MRLIRTEKHCTRCTKLLPMEAFSTSGYSNKGLRRYHAHCKECALVYQRKRRASGIPMKPKVLATACNICANILTSDNKVPVKVAHGQKWHNRCRTCFSKNLSAWSKTPAQKIRVKSYWLKTKYGITLAEYDDRIRKQGGVCAVCKEMESTVDPRTGVIRALAVDHCHKSGKIRGLLCDRCNRAAGFLRDRADVAIELAAYLSATALDT